MHIWCPRYGAGRGETYYAFGIEAVVRSLMLFPLFPRTPDDCARPKHNKIVVQFRRSFMATTTIGATHGAVTPICGNSMERKPQQVREQRRSPRIQALGKRHKMHATTECVADFVHRRLLPGEAHVMSGKEKEINGVETGEWIDESRKRSH